DCLNQKVGLLKLLPGVDREVMEFMLGHFDALIIESFGVGGLPQRRGLHSMVYEAAEAGKTIVMTTQVQNEGSDMAVYSTGHSLKGNPRILEAHDMTTEAVTAKMMWILGKTSDLMEIQRLFYTPVNRDILTMVNFC
ncbi:MAG: L-asparaginase 1, partial [Oscillospiraceae bacterium]